MRSLAPSHPLLPLLVPHGPSVVHNVLGATARSDGRQLSADLRRGRLDGAPLGELGDVGEVPGFEMSKEMETFELHFI